MKKGSLSDEIHIPGNAGKPERNLCRYLQELGLLLERIRDECAVLLGSVNKNGHLYRTLQETKEAVINFMSAEAHAACMATIHNNEFDKDEIAASGLTAEKADWVNAPMVKECFMNLECRYVWEKEIVPGDDHVIICLEVLGGHIDEEHLADRTGENGLLYNIHYQMNPEHPGKTGHDYAAVLQRKVDVGEY